MQGAIQVASVSYSFVRFCLQDTEFTQQVLQLESECAVCLSNGSHLALELCHHRLCGECAHTLLETAKVMPLLCPVCRCIVVGYSVPERLYGV